MSGVLFAWIGKADLRAAAADGRDGLGPIAQALAAPTLDFDHIILLNAFPQESIAPFERWIREKTKADVVVEQHKLSSPTNHADIYRAVVETITSALKKFGPKAEFTFHLSPGTPAMAAVWIIVAKTRFTAALIESSPEQGVAAVTVPFELAADFIPAAIHHANEDLERLGEGLRDEEPNFSAIVYRSDVMKRLVLRARRAAPYKAAILIEGESGTGKELLARAIHKESQRAKKIVVVNCGAIPRELFESLFFGHDKGSFTGADKEHVGYFEQASNSTLFLDEIGDLPTDQQVKLLRVLQEKTVRRVGGKSDIDIGDMRVIAATNRNLLNDVRSGRFREDLYYRVATITLRMPPLRDREVDINPLCEHLLEKIATESSQAAATIKKLSAGARNRLQRHRWPGNVRELEATLMRAFVWSSGAEINTSEIEDALVSAPTSDDGDVLGRSLEDGFKLDDLLGEVSQHYLARAMKEAGGNKKKAAAALGLDSATTLTNRLKKHKMVQ